MRTEYREAVARARRWLTRQAPVSQNQDLGSCAKHVVLSACTFNIELAQMTDPSKLSGPSEDRPLAQPSYSWWMEILWGLGIGALLGGVVVGVIFLDRMRLIPSWVFGWISSDRETQKHQFRLALYGLFAFWIVTRFVKLGLFGRIARTTYKGALLKLTITPSKPDDEVHARICAIKNARIAALLVGFFTLEVFLSWRELGRPFVEHSLYDLLFRIASVFEL